jgi:hypothetical protein
MASNRDLVPGIFMSENLRECLCSITDTEFQRFFDSLRQTQLNKIEHAKTRKELTQLQAKVSMVTEMQGIFFALRTEAKQQQEQETRTQR